jgi:haloalkane dehalogenase
MTSSQDAAFTEHRIRRDRGSLYVRDFPGSKPAFVVLHGFPDNSRIYDDLIPHLVSAGRRTVVIDFLGFGASDKPEGAHYSFEQQLGDLEAVVEALGLDKIIPVGHDAGGPAAVNFALRHPDRTAAVILMNAFCGDAPGRLVPELIETEFLGPVIDNNFRQLSAGPAFAQMTYQLTDEVAANTARLVEFRRSDVPLLLIWGKPIRTFMSPSPSTCDPRPGMRPFMSLMQGIGHRSMSLLTSLGSCLQAINCKGDWQPLGGLPRLRIAARRLGPSALTGSRRRPMVVERQWRMWAATSRRATARDRAPTRRVFANQLLAGECGTRIPPWR